MTTCMLRIQWLSFPVLFACTQMGAAEVESDFEFEEEPNGLSRGQILPNGTFEMLENKGSGRLVLVHVPWNFGHTMEKVAWTNDAPDVDKGAFWDAAYGPTRNLALLQSMKRQGGETWGATDSRLIAKSSVGCDMYMTPPNIWSPTLAQSYFGNKQRFGILRDPYERLVAIFRGNLGSYYGGAYHQFYSTCDVDGAVNKMMDDAARNKYAHNCVFVPQAEYFGGPYGATVFVDNTQFPDSMNAVLHQYGYAWNVDQSDIIHVRGCDNVWAGDLKPATKQRVQQHFARDFDLRCEKFGLCNREDAGCLKKIPGMCPSFVPGALVHKKLDHYGDGVVKAVLKVAYELSAHNDSFSTVG